MLATRSSVPEPFLKWRPEFELGLPEIDAQHRGLLQAINDLAEAVLGEDAEQARKAMRVLLRRSRAHFDFEEALMRSRCYPDVAIHAEQHAELHASISRLNDELQIGRHVLNRPGMLRFLRDWFAIHVVRSDARFAGFMAHA